MVDQKNKQQPYKGSSYAGEQQSVGAEGSVLVEESDVADVWEPSCSLDGAVAHEVKAALMNHVRTWGFTASLLRGRTVE